MMPRTMSAKEVSTTTRLLLSLSLALVLWRTVTYCHDTRASRYGAGTDSAVAALISAAWCGADPTPSPAPSPIRSPDVPRNPVPEISALCLHYADGCTSGGATLAFWLLGFLIPRRIGKKISLAHRAKAEPGSPSRSHAWRCAGV